MHTPDPAEATFREFIPHILATESEAQHEYYGAYWRLLLTERGPGRLTDSDPRRDPAADEPVQSRRAGCKKVFADKKFGKDVEREQLSACLDYMGAGDADPELIATYSCRWFRPLDELETRCGLTRGG
ncbi:hypothetical protein [Nocardia carnea]|uniref:hypothetical protein n=1 Tax=Nocardia carnea TaxID=37328 RepID=UPI0024543074|nr:hypothetical protein [Nocardia carnea]